MEKGFEIFPLAMITFVSGFGGGDKPVQRPSFGQLSYFVAFQSKVIWTIVPYCLFWPSPFWKGMSVGHVGEVITSPLLTAIYLGGFPARHVFVGKRVWLAMNSSPVVP
jgi:hypothetical protein